jgi:hypothetical protein
VAGCCECGDEPSGSGATELVRSLIRCNYIIEQFLPILFSYQIRLRPLFEGNIIKYRRRSLCEQLHVVCTVYMST